MRKEINEILNSKELSLEDINHMTLFEATLCETLRIRPVVPVGIPHGVLKDLQIGEYEIPKGTMIIPLLWAIHMNSDVWENPEDFNPWRFIDEEGKIIKSDNLMAFQAGRYYLLFVSWGKMTYFGLMPEISRQRTDIGGNYFLAIRTAIVLSVLAQNFKCAICLFTSVDRFYK